MDAEINKILIVEDSRTQAIMLESILESEGYETKTASSGKDALKILEEFTPTVIISDIVMPEMDGYELCQEIKANEVYQDIPIILLTSLSDPYDVIRGLQCGADNFITKPYKTEFLLSRIHYILTNRELRLANGGEPGIPIYFAGEKLTINSSRFQIIDLLFSSFENAVEKNEDLKEANERLRETQVQLEAQSQELKNLNSEKDRVLGVVAHDLRGPLGSIQMCHDVVTDDSSDEATKQEFLQIIRDVSSKALQLVDDLLDVSVIESGKLVLEKEAVEVTGFLQKIIMMNRPLAENKNIRLELEDHSPDEWEFDRNRIEQVLDNFLTNAFKFSHSGTTVRLKVEAVDSKLQFQVFDQGQGICEEDLEKLFSAFQKTSTRPTGSEGSSGLGLSICKRIVEQHGGEVGVESVYGEGCCFSFYLPSSV